MSLASIHPVLVGSTVSLVLKKGLDTRNVKRAYIERIFLPPISGTTDDLLGTNSSPKQDLRNFSLSLSLSLTIDIQIYLLLKDGFFVFFYLINYFFN